MEKCYNINLGKGICKTPAWLISFGNTESPSLCTLSLETRKKPRKVRPNSAPWYWHISESQVRFKIYRHAQRIYNGLPDCRITRCAPIYIQLCAITMVYLTCRCTSISHRQLCDRPLPKLTWTPSLPFPAGINHFSKIVKGETNTAYVAQVYPKATSSHTNKQIDWDFFSVSL